MPRFMLLVDPGETDSGRMLEPVRALNAYNDELARAGALLALDGLHPPAARCRCAARRRPRR